MSQAIIHLNEPLSPPRIGGIAAALAIHVAALMMLMAPMTYAPPMPITEEQAFVPEDIKPILPDRPKPAPIDKKPQITPVLVPLVQKQQIAPIDVPPILINVGSTNDTPYFETPTSGEPTLPFTAPPSGPISLSTEYAPAPNYPIVSLRNGEQGTVLLLVKVDATGKPIDVTLKKSSGYRELDKNAIKHVLANWRFHPAMHQGIAIPALALVPINYSINP
jgi:periplasmic protein TonB